MRLGSASTLWRIQRILPRPFRPDRLTLLPALALVLVAAAACGGESTEGLGTLPPIRTTTTSSTTTTLFDPTIELYTVKRGENLSLIARSFEVPLEFLIEANEDVINDPNNVPPGVTLKIPPYRIVDELPTPSSTTEAP
ncbi:MAG: LysM peptidoglycan-binding domain-containing protein [Ilumatobacteraceae bacterium]|nr:LysM peptidoglycan-binding domain-containing protein [Ilumatobacteraceae bacterium]